jgi:hypothetical protein
MTAPVLSVTVPEMAPLPVSCPLATPVANMAIANTATHIHPKLRKSPCPGPLIPLSRFNRTKASIHYTASFQFNGPRSLVIGITRTYEV